MADGVLEQRRLAAGAGEAPSSPAEVDDRALCMEHDPADVAHDQGGLVVGEPFAMLEAPGAFSPPLVPTLRGPRPPLGPTIFACIPGTGSGSDAITVDIAASICAELAAHDVDKGAALSLEPFAGCNEVVRGPTARTRRR